MTDRDLIPPIGRRTSHLPGATIAFGGGGSAANAGVGDAANDIDIDGEEQNPKRSQIDVVWILRQGALISLEHGGGGGKVGMERRPEPSAYSLDSILKRCRTVLDECFF